MKSRMVPSAPQKKTCCMTVMAAGLRPSHRRLTALANGRQASGPLSARRKLSPRKREPTCTKIKLPTMAELRRMPRGALG